MTDELAIIETTFLPEFREPEKYAPMVEYIRRNLPEITRATASFNKTDSQFNNNFLTLTSITPIRNLRQILAEMKKTRQALGEAHFGVRKKRLEIEKLTLSLKNLKGLDKEIIQTEIQEREFNIACIMENVEGAIRRLANFQKQYDDITKSHALEGFTEEDFEREEERYHITRAFSQALNAARSHQGYIDEGNQIYLQQIGVNGTQAQMEVNAYLSAELSAVQSGETLDYEREYSWLLEMAEKFKGCSQRLAKLRGQTGNITEIAL